jgi:hypothetical protein
MINTINATPEHTILPAEVSEVVSATLDPSIRGVLARMADERWVIGVNGTDWIMVRIETVQTLIRAACMSDADVIII